jgi:hypothetical protein
VSVSNASSWGGETGVATTAGPGCATDAAAGANGADITAAALATPACLKRSRREGALGSSEFISILAPLERALPSVDVAVVAATARR